MYSVPTIATEEIDKSPVLDGILPTGLDTIAYLVQLAVILCIRPVKVDSLGIMVLEPLALQYISLLSVYPA